MKRFGYGVTIELYKEAQADFERDLKKLLSSHGWQYDFEVTKEEDC